MPVVNVKMKYLFVTDAGRAFVLREPAIAYMRSLGVKNAPLKAKDMGDFNGSHNATRT